MQKIADREDEYKARRRQMIISPERLDPFADGKICHYFSPHHNLPIYAPFHGSLETIGWLFYPSTAMQNLAPITVVCP